MDAITLHQVGIADIAVLVEMRIAFALELSGPQPNEAIDALRKQLTGFFSEAIPNQISVSFIARFDGEVAGIGTVQIRQQPGNFKNPSGKWGYVMNMYTIPAFRRKGICKAILLTLLDEAKRMGVTAFELHATKEGEYVYAQNGFKIFEEPTYRQYLT
ncbi:MAG: GNAT family N-acetyltransferase [Bacteroidia bacterium]